MKPAFDLHRVVTPISAIVFAAVLSISLETLAGDAALLVNAGFNYVIAGALYLASHGVRATRLAIIAMPILGISFRTGFLIHLFVAPWSLLLPFKLDEAIRIGELSRAGRSLPRAITVSLIDRSMDGIVLIALSWPLLKSGHDTMGSFTGFVGLGLTLIALGFFILPLLLEMVQRHIFSFHYRDSAFRVLKAVSELRSLLALGRGTIASVFPFLAVSTVAIWAMELGAAFVLITAFGPPRSGSAAADLMLRRADASWQILLLGNRLDPVQSALTLTFLLALLVPWPVIAWSYGRRLACEPLRMRLRERVSPVASLHSGRK